MRPVSRPQSALRAPLNHILGTEANVRVLRVVFLSDIPIGVSELARRTELQGSGVARVCTRLEDLGVIEAVGRGARNQQYRRAARFAFSNALTQLFSLEQARADEVIQDIRTAVQNMGARAAWIEGAVAREQDRPGDPILVGLLVEPEGVESVRVNLGQQLLSVQRNRDVVIELRIMTIADLKTLDDAQRTELDTVKPLAGPPPLDLAEVSGDRGSKERAASQRDHAALDSRSKEMAQLIADRIRRDPSLVEDAKSYIERRLPQASPGEQLELREWKDILSSMSIPRLRRFLVQDNQRATKLRQSSPFLNVLSAEDREKFFNKPGRKR